METVNVVVLAPGPPLTPPFLPFTVHCVQVFCAGIHPYYLITDKYNLKYATYQKETEKMVAF